MPKTKESESATGSTEVFEPLRYYFWNSKIMNLKDNTEYLQSSYSS